MTIGPVHYLVLSAMVFCAGLAGVLVRRHATGQLICLCLMLLAPVLAFAGISQVSNAGPGVNTGAGVALIGVVAFAAQGFVAMSILILASRRRGTIDSAELERED